MGAGDQGIAESAILRIEQFGKTLHADSGIWEKGRKVPRQIGTPVNGRLLMGVDEKCQLFPKRSGPLPMDLVDPGTRRGFQDKLCLDL
jgi:hypothetical protein